MDERARPTTTQTPRTDHVHAELGASRLVVAGAPAQKMVVVHVGTHKTGTKSLQTMLSENREWFEEQGLAYPVAACVQYGHHNVAWELTGDTRYDPATGSLEDVVTELARTEAPTALLSSEDLESLYRRPDPMARLRASLEGIGYDVHVVVTLREPADYTESLYEELLKHGLTQSADEFVDQVLANRAIIFRNWDLCLDYRRLVSGFTDVFGIAAVHTLRYDKADSVSTVLSACGRLFGRPIRPVLGWERQNVRQPVQATEPCSPGGHSDAPTGPLTEDQRNAVELLLRDAFEDAVLHSG